MGGTGSPATPGGLPDTADGVSDHPHRTATTEARGLPPLESVGPSDTHNAPDPVVFTRCDERVVRDHRIATRRGAGRGTVEAVCPWIVALAVGMPAVVAAVVLIVAGLIAVHAPSRS
ncbi:MAG: hypothetical protein QOH43_4459 [Solirubrobacteraceae bacterium]|jgi:hypothetical protein|nr:hypothetical protein [Solirubrobacteraceae bacterium]